MFYQERQQPEERPDAYIERKELLYLLAELDGNPKKEQNDIAEEKAWDKEELKVHFCQGFTAGARLALWPSARTWGYDNDV